MPRITKREADISEAMVSIHSSGMLKFDRNAKAAFARRRIESASFIDERTGRATGRLLTSAERRDLGEKARRCTQPGEVKNFGDFLREIGIKTSENRRYRARWSSTASHHLIVRIK
jgi:hypothetical protein